MNLRLRLSLVWDVTNEFWRLVRWLTEFLKMHFQRLCECDSITMSVHGSL